MVNRAQAYNIGFNVSGSFSRRPTDPGHLESDDFYINDVVLRISPDQISISKDSYDHKISTLRTRQSRNSKSGYGIVHISISVPFRLSNLQDQDNLTRVVAGLRATPFCVVHNKYLDDMLGRPDSDSKTKLDSQRATRSFQPIMLAMSSMSFSTLGHEGKPDCIDAQFDFLWFNYLPFTNFIAFKAGNDLNRPGHAWESGIWQAFYEPFYLQQSGVRFPHEEGDSYSRTTDFMWREFVMVPTGNPAAVEASKELVEVLKKKPKVIIDILEDTVLEGLDTDNIADAANPDRITPQVMMTMMRKAAASGAINISEELRAKLASMPDGALNNEIQDILMPTIRKMYQANHSSLQHKDALENASAVLGKRLKEFKNIKKYGGVTLDSINQVDYTKLLDVQSKTERKGKRFSAGGYQLFGRKARKSIVHQNSQDYFEGPDAIIQQIVVSFQNTLATIPVAQYRYPTIQHVGSIDAQVHFIINARNSGARDLSAMFDQVQSSSLNFKQVPAGFTNLNIQNDFLSLFGLSEFIPNKITVNSTPEQPSRSSVVMTLTEAGLTSKTRLDDPEQINQEFVSTTTGIKKEILRILWLDTDQKTARRGYAPRGSQNQSDYWEPWQSSFYFREVSGITKDNRDKAYLSLVEEMVKIHNEFIKRVINFTTLKGTTVDIIASRAIILELKEDDPVYGYIPFISIIQQRMKNAIGEYDKKFRKGKDITSGKGTISDRNDIVSDLGIGNYVREMAALVNKIDRNFLVLDKFKHVLKTKDNLGLNKGLLAYPDFKQQLFSVASRVEGIKTNDNNVLMKYDPDCYFYYPAFNGGTDSPLLGLIDSATLAAAKAHSKKITKNAYDNINEFFKHKYLPKLKNPNHEEPYNLVTNQGKKNDLDRFLYENLEYSNALSQEKIRIDVVPDAVDKMPINWYGSGKSGPTMNAFNLGATCKHSTDMDKLFGGLETDASPSGQYNGNASGHNPDDNTEGETGTSGASSKIKFYWPIKPRPGILPPRYLFGISRKETYGKPVHRHGGLDMPEPRRGDFTKGPSDGIYGTPVYAAADGAVVSVKYGRKRKGGGHVGGLMMHIYHKGGWVTAYMHLLEGSTIARGTKVQAGDFIGRIGRTGNRNSYTHLHFEILNPNRQKVDPLALLPKGEESIQNARRYDPKGLKRHVPESIGRSPTAALVSPITESVREFEKDLYNGQAQSMMRAYPAFKLYFIEDDSSEKRLSFDDFFSYHAIQSIRVVKSRKIPADMCEIYLSNASGILSNRKFRHNRKGHLPFTSTDKPAGESNKAMDAGTSKENPIASLLLQEGIQISLRMGYCNDPNRMPTVFNGVITEVQFSESDDVVRILAQSHAIELIQDLKGAIKPQTKDSTSIFGWNTWGFDQNATTGRILEEMLGQPEVLHFGRWVPNLSGSNPVRSALTQRWTFNPQPADDNVFAPSPSQDMGEISNGTFFKNLKYIIYKTTIWDIFQEMTLRHPNFIASVVPYTDQGGQRSTMFFGLPNQSYFHRHPSSEEALADAKLVKIQKEVMDKVKKRGIGVINRQLQKGDQVKQFLGDVSLTLPGSVSIRSREKAVSNFFREARVRQGTQAGYIKPFRNYHLITSAQHIVENNINANSRDVANTIMIEYFDSDSDSEEQAEGTVSKGDAQTFTLKIDNALPTEEIRTQVSAQVNVFNEELAKRYALGLLTRNLKDIYKGQVVILGNPSIKCYDVCYLMDEYSEMVGGFEVEEVQHIFDQQSGFRTEIKPDMLVQANEMSLLGSAEALGVVAEGWLRKSVGTGISRFSVLPYIMGHATNFFGGFLAQKIINYTQLAQPVIMSPLQHHGRMFTGGIPTRKIPTSIWNTSFGEWSSEMERGYQEWISDTKEDVINWAKRVTFQNTVGDFWNNGGDNS